MEKNHIDRNVIAEATRLGAGDREETRHALACCTSQSVAHEMCTQIIVFERKRLLMVGRFE